MTCLGAWGKEDTTGLHVGRSSIGRAPDGEDARFKSCRPSHGGYGVLVCASGCDPEGPCSIHGSHPKLTISCWVHEIPVGTPDIGGPDRTVNALCLHRWEFNSLCLHMKHRYRRLVIWPECHHEPGSGIDITDQLRDAAPELMAALNKLAQELDPRWQAHRAKMRRLHTNYPRKWKKL
jgi:hypothetical protein